MHLPLRACESERLTVMEGDIRERGEEENWLRVKGFYGKWEKEACPPDEKNSAGAAGHSAMQLLVSVSR